MTLVSQIALSEICFMFRTELPRAIPVSAGTSSLWIFCHAAVTSQLRIQSLTPSQLIRSPHQSLLFEGTARARPYPDQSAVTNSGSLLASAMPNMA